MNSNGDASTCKSKDKANLTSANDKDGQATINLLNEEQSLSVQQRWISLAESRASYSIEAWLKAIEQMIKHPEQSSSTILRADIMEDDERCESKIGHLLCQRRILRKILPRRPNLDRSLDQVCTIYVNDAKSEGLALLVPLLTNNSVDDIPYYHPKVQSLAFHYRKTNTGAAFTRLFIVPFEEDQDFNPISQPQSRLSRTALILLNLQSRLAFGVENGYQKRVEHDVLVDRKEYQELYMHLRNRHASFLMQTWCESTDPGKHVFEDLGIVTFIILLWRSMFPRTRGKPPCFVDVGCGNGLLVYLLSREGYSGFGLDVQSRKSWDHFRNCLSTIDLRCEPIDPPAICSDTQKTSIFPHGSFLIGNHADELTSWLPFIAHSIPNCTGLINIPCCRFDLDGTISSRSKYGIDEQSIKEIVGEHDLANAMMEIKRGPFAEADSTSRNIAYLRYISHLHLQAGWQLEKEALRIPSTKNWALIGKKRIWQDQNDHNYCGSRKEDIDENVRSIAQRLGAQWHARISPNKSQKNH